MSFADEEKKDGECQWCGTFTELTRFKNGTTWTDWICVYCSCHFNWNDPILRSISCMLHTLENRIKESK